MKAAYSPMQAGVLLLFLTLLNALNFTDRFLIQGFAVDIIRDLQLSKVEFTLLTGFVFTGFYTLVGLVMGVLADRLHRPRLMAAGLLFWSVLTMATGAVTNFAQAAAVRVFTGVGEATLTPAALGLLGDVMHPSRRAFASGCYYIGSPLDIGLAFIVAGNLGTMLGWRQCFLLLGTLGVLLCFGLLLLREPRATRDSPKTTKAREFAPLQEMATLFRTSPALCLVFAGAICVIFAQGTFVLDQLWLVQERGFAKAHAQNLFGMMFLCGGVLGAVLGGWCGDALQTRIAGGRLYFLAFAYMVGAPLGYGLRLADPAGYIFLPCMFAASVMATIGYGAIFASVQDLTPAHLRSSTTALLILCMTLFGTSPGNLTVGWLADALTHTGHREPITDAVLIASSVWLPAIPCFWLAAKWVKKKRLRT